MVSLSFSLLVFLVTIATHVMLYQALQSRKELAFKTAGVFGFGLIISVFVHFILMPTVIYLPVTTWWAVPLPLTSLALYALLASIYILFFTNIYWGEESPSFAIYFLVKRYRKLTAAEIRTHFSDKKIIGSRLTDLLNERYVYKKGDRYLLTSRGKFVYSVTEFYRKILNWQSGG